MIKWRQLWVAVALGGILPLPAAESSAPKVDYNRDIRPILSDHCYACHGPDEKARKAGLRLDLKEEAFKPAKSGALAIVPGDLAKSELVHRITTSDDDDRMPPAKKGKPLSAAQIDTLKRWVEQGAEWKGHWAYLKPERPELPEVKNKTWPKNPIDNFILAKLEANGLEPSPEADRHRLIRRVTFDLTGLPPTIEDIAAFLSDKSKDAYEKVVDRLLASKHYGERMAMFWLDLARYADTQGYHHDAHRDMYRWRDYVINSLNDNKPFDQFTIEQLAGDLLPDATLEQKIATGFQRNEMTTSEGGAIPEEYMVKYVAGRVDTAARVWLGTSLACAECHDHKYDPISQKDYYRFFAYFNSVPENGLDASPNPVPRVVIESREQTERLAQLEKEVGALESLDKSLLEEAHAAHDAAQKEWQDKQREKFVKSWQVLSPASQSARSGATLTRLPDESLLASGTNAPKELYEVSFKTDLQGITGIRLEALPDDSLPGKKSGRGEKGDFQLTAFTAEAHNLNPEKIAATAPPKLGNWFSLGPFKAGSGKEAFDKKVGPEDGVDLKKAYGDTNQHWQEQADWKDGEVHSLTGENSATYLYRTITLKQARYAMMSIGSDDGVQVWVNGRRLLTKEIERSVAPDQDKVTAYLKAGENKILIKVVNVGGDYGFYFKLLLDPVKEHPVEFAAGAADFKSGNDGAGGALDDKDTTGWSVGSDDNDATRPHQAFFRTEFPFGFEGGTELKLKLSFDSPTPQLSLGRFRVAVTTAEGLNEFFEPPDAVRAALIADDETRSGGQKMELQKYYRRTFIPEIKQWTKTLAEQRKQRDEYRDSIPVSMVMQDAEKPRDTFLLVRGEYNNRGEKVTPGVPQHIMPLPEDYPANRLGLAKWLVNPDHPLTSRVTVNHFWQQYFGTGIVKTAEDFGSQGEWPSHPELLDWLATEFIRTGWNIKAIQRLIVTSATYRQSSEVTKQHLAIDPENRLLARFPRLRLEAEAIRDNALSVSGLLKSRIGGPSVYPYQPPGLWEQVAFEGTRSWVQTEGDDSYRRGLYTYWRRSIPYPSLITFDAPTRETCTVRRPRTNTPLQALVLMNDPVYVEASRALGYRVMMKGGKSLRDKVNYAFKLCLARPPSSREARLLERAYKRELQKFTADRVAASKLINVGSRPPVAVDICELAAWTTMGNILLNLDEMINKG